MANATILVREVIRVVKLLTDIRTEVRGLRADLRRINGIDTVPGEAKPFTKSANNGYLNGGVKK